LKNNTKYDYFIFHTHTRTFAEFLSANGGSNDVSVHSCQSSRLEFLARNFEFNVIPFKTLIEKCFQSTNNKNKNDDDNDNDNDDVSLFYLVQFKMIIVL
jgi:hypothetical protein